MECITGKIIGYNERTRELTITATYEHYELLADRKYSQVEIGLADGRRITPEQRKKAYALMGEIADWAGETPSYIKRLMKFEFITNEMKALTKSMFSLSDCDVTTAREYITFLIDFVLEHDIPLNVPILEVCEDIQKAVYSCLMNKRCIICGQKAQLHHVDAVGAGRDRKEIVHIGMRVVPLCAAHHTEAHTKGNEWLFNEMHVEPVKLDKKIGRVYRLNKKNLGEKDE